MPSMNSNLIRLNLYLLSGKALSHLVAPFTEARSILYLSVSYQVENFHNKESAASSWNTESDCSNVKLCLIFSCS